MATLVLTTVGSLLGGPVGGALGALVGRQIDGAVFGTRKVEGPRLKELGVTTSSYGQPIGRQYGRVRVPGTVIWATDLKESRDSSGGGKGKPASTSYSYSISFAVALSSRPIDAVGRIWADGNLLRGAAGDLKTGGTLRIHTGHADQDRDPLLSAALGEQCPAFRGCAYVVFEDLQLADFGNRIPMLSFEVDAGSGSDLVTGLVEGMGSVTASAPIPELEGFSQDGGSIGQILALVDRLHPLSASYGTGTTSLVPMQSDTNGIRTLPPAVRWDEGDFGRENGISRARKPRGNSALVALRYYDPARDYQPGLQRTDAEGGGGRGDTIEFPGVLSATHARSLLHAASAREGVRQDTLAWRLAELDPAIQPGSIVRAPGIAGEWTVAGWEWREKGVEIQLVRRIAMESIAAPADPGSARVPLDRLPQPTGLRVFELPWDGVGSPGDARVYAAASAPAGPWSGAQLYAVSGTALVPTGETLSERAVTGKLESSLDPSLALRFEAAAEMTVRLDNDIAQLTSTSVASLATGANRLLVGGEVVQFADAIPAGDGVWTLRGLLRGRGGTESAAAPGHGVATPVTLIDERLLPIPPGKQGLADAGEFAALGLADAEPVVANLENAGASRRPPSPCHAIAMEQDGTLFLSWTRRARGGWAWLDEVEQPLVEQSELYEVGVGPVDAPVRRFATTEPRLVVDAATTAAMAADHPGAALWVRQCGSFAVSEALLLTFLPTNS